MDARLVGMAKLKKAEKDYEVSMLPSTRKEVFFDVLKLNKRKLLMCGAITLLFTLPFLVTSIMKSGLETALYRANETNQITDLQFITSIQLYDRIFAFANVILFLIVGICLAGMSRIIKLFVWEENVSVGTDFWKGIKQNIRQFLLLSFIVGIIYFLCSYLYSCYSYVGGSPLNWGTLVGIIVGLLLGPIAAYMTVTISVYDLKFKEQIKYSLLLFGKNFLKTYAAALPCFAIFVPQLIPNLYCQIIGRSLSGLLIPLVMLGWFSYVMYCLDKDFNKQRYPELLHRGLYIAESQDDVQ